MLAVSKELSQGTAGLSWVGVEAVVEDRGARRAKARAAELNAKYEEILAKARVGVRTEKPVAVRVAAPAFAPVVLVGKVTVGELAKQYLNHRSPVPPALGHCLGQFCHPLPDLQ